MARKRRIFSTGVQIQSFLKGITNSPYRNLLRLIIGSLLGFTVTFCVPALSHNELFLSATNLEQHQSKILLAQTQIENESDILAIAKEGQKRYNAGQFGDAISLWQQTAEAYENIGNQEGLFKSLINQAQAWQNLGSYPRACNTLLQAFSVDQPDCNSEQVEFVLSQFSENPNALSLNQAIGFRSLGNVLRRQGKLEESQKALTISLSKVLNSREEPSTRLSLGNTERALGIQTRNRWNYEQITEIIASQSISKALEPDISAIESYKLVETLSYTQPITKVQAQLNHLSLLLDIRQWWEEQANLRIASWSRANDIRLTQRAKGFLELLDTEINTDISRLNPKIESNINNLPQNPTTVSANINYAHNLLTLLQLSNVEPILKTAVQEAKTLQDRKAESYALGYLGQLYYQQWQQLEPVAQQNSRGNTLLSEATQSTQQALLLANDALEISYLWQSQLGNLLKEQGDVKGAISSYMAAFNTLQSLRTDLNENNQDLQFDFRQQIKPVYKSLADLLLKTDLSKQELESLVVLNPKTTQRQSKTPLQKNRLELARRVIESLQIAELDNFFQDSCLEETEVTVQIEDLDSQAAVIYPIIFPDRLELLLSLPKQPLQQITIPVTEAEFNLTLDRLYDNLYNESLNDSAINIFRTIPLNPTEVKDNTQKLLSILTQLYDWLIQPLESELNSKQIQTLVFVLNDRLQRVPMAALYNGQQYLIENYSVALVPSIQLESINPQQLDTKSLSILAAGVSQQIQVEGEIFPALNKVPEELKQIEADCPNCQKLLNEEFTVTRLKSELKKQSYDVVHLATHGLFSSNPNKTFIITGDGETINIDELSELLAVEPTNIPELLVLSACNTATGDEQAILGLAGVAVRSGTRSTIASLWPVGDEFTASLMDKFYQELKKPDNKKVNALQSAQLSLIDFLNDNPRFEATQNLPPHPYYWAPYVLVGNWL
ncbi:MAG: CHAT domain-containing protein [Xenococcaceae cyanobacterium MO_207.B15]|nr:CHAT domain-containing protein [Xenococcaceae cyanobacterium MO_207.B15]